jgi:hypothetical protein
MSDPTLLKDPKMLFGVSIGVARMGGTHDILFITVPDLEDPEGEPIYVCIATSSDDLRQLSESLKAPFISPDSSQSVH